MKYENYYNYLYKSIINGTMCGVDVYLLTSNNNDDLALAAFDVLVDTGKHMHLFCNLRAPEAA